MPSFHNRSYLSFMPSALNESLPKSKHFDYTMILFLSHFGADAWFGKRRVPNGVKRELVNVRLKGQYRPIAARPNRDGSSSSPEIILKAFIFVSYSN
ncbi:hypothetical protein AVEN_211841-1 [Araneus ventricosus]|uniref:Uncharacterized protein n=1 Tax=Araneus ventricosus TaxID=182803 RepID=A0A4Y2HHV0_ARAVE|nr:hypothetical protein AVEN_211841-1 [Araneus ventricosus]